MEALHEARIKLKEGEVHLWTETLIPPVLEVESAKRILSDEERNRAARFLRPADHDRYVICHMLVRTILSRYLEVAPAEIRFQREKFGKPYLDPRINPHGLNFNISHSGEKMLLGLVLKARIGVDIEEIRPESATAEVAERFFTKWENEQLRSLKGEERTRGFFNCWTRKEAYMKAVGCGLSASTLNCEVSLRPGVAAAIHTALPTADGAGRWTVFHYEPEPAYVGAIAVDVSAAALTVCSQVTNGLPGP